MKKSNLKAVVIVAVFSILTVSCSSSDDNPNGGTPVPSAENTWTLDSNNYLRSNSTQTSTTYTNGQPFTVVNVDSNFNTNAVFKTCNLVPTFNTSTVGTYVVKSQSTVLANVTQKTMYIRCFVTNGQGGGAMYESIDSNVNASVTSVAGKFVVNVPDAVTVSRIYVDNFPQAPQTFSLKCTNVR